MSDCNMRVYLDVHSTRSSMNTLILFNMVLLYKQAMPDSTVYKTNLCTTHSLHDMKMQAELLYPSLKTIVGYCGLILNGQTVGKLH